MELIVFDFDHTLVDCNSDTYVTKLAPNQTIPDHIKKYFQPNDWTEYMRNVFVYLHESNVLPSAILRCLSEMPLLAGMKELLLALHSNNNVEVIVISDANSVFIDHTLRTAGLSHVVRKIYTNPAYFDAKGCLQLKEYHIQDWCTLSSRNMCKGFIMESHIKQRKDEGIVFKRVSYIGDGQNDLCPSLRLTASDRVFPRKSFRLERLLRKNEEKVKSQVFPWADGWDILKVIMEAQVPNKL